MEALQAFSGLSVVLLTVMVLVIVILALALFKHRTPAQQLRATEDWLKSEGSKDWDELVSGFKSAEDAARDEAEKLLERAQAWLTDTMSQDEKIAEHKQGIADQEAIKADKAAMLKLHVEKLQALSAPPATDTPSA